jgi:OOP family OmpA-OmpF porin
VNRLASTFLVVLAASPVAAQPDFSGMPCRDASLAPNTYIDEHRIYFSHGRADLPTDARTRMVLESAACLLKLKPARVAIIAHADTSGAAEFNLMLSRRRARAVAEALQARGVDPYSITVEARGELAPAVGTGDGVAEQLNRRVVIGW